MSLPALNWLFSLKAGETGHSEFRVLFQLCHAHNPEHGCFPTQGYLLEKTGVSNGTLNNCLRSLEEKALIQRHRSRDKRSKRQRPTRYILGFEKFKPQKPTPKSGDGFSENRLQPNGDGSGKSRLQSGAKAVSNLDAKTEKAVSNSDHDPSPVGWRVRGNEEVSKREAIASQKNGDEPNPSAKVVALSLFSNEAGLEVEKPKPPPKRKTALPENWVPSEKNIADARNHNFTDQEIRDEAEQFRDYHLARGTVFKSWDAGWRTWLRNARKFGRRGGASANRNAAEMDRESFLRQNDAAGRAAIARFQSRS